MNYITKFVMQISSGFFSDFNVIVGCLDFIKTNQINNFSFVWNNIYYQNNSDNLFDKIFFKTPTYDFYDKEIDVSSIGSTYYKPFNSRKKFINSHNIIKHFNYFENPYYQTLKSNCAKRDNCLGVHVRGTDHWRHGPIVDLDTYFKFIDRKLFEESYTNIFLATDEVRVVQGFQSRYGDKVFTNDEILRSETADGIHLSGVPNKEKLIEDVMLDAISLSLCDEILITSSNVSGYALTVNPFIKYTFIDWPS